MKKLLTLAVALLFVTTASAQKVQIFDNTPINASGANPDLKPTQDGTIYTAAGRLVFKKVTFPKFKNTTKATLNLTVASAGDRWDKSGSCFIVPAGSENNIWEVLNGRSQFPASTKAVGDMMKGHALIENYKPALELLRFMTPFGVGHYSDDQLKRKPVYIPHWEKEVSWTQDISQLISELQGEALVGIWIDSWTPEGYVATLDITFEESALKCDKMVATKVLPLFNTVYYTGALGSPTMFADQPQTTIDFELPKGAKNAKLYYITTGHGGHSGGDEFVKVQNIVEIDQNTVIDFVPWRDDCASFRRFNPGSGVWIRKRVAPYIGKGGQYEEKEIEESLASSDLSRSNWCPGSCITPEVAPLNIGAGKHSLTMSMPTAQKAEGSKFNHWLVSAYVVYQE